jgi:type IV pilus assembly protein PilF
MLNRVKVSLTLLLVIFVTSCQQGSTKPDEYVAPDPKAAEINVQLGMNYLQRGDFQTALDKLEKALRQNPNLPSAHNTIALLYQSLNKLEQAEEHFLEAVKRAPQYSEAQNNYGVFLCQQNRYEEAEARFLKALENPLYKSAAQALENAGLCMSRMQNMDKSEEYFRKALQRNPNLPKSLIQMAEINFERGDYLQSRAYVQRYQSVARWTAKALYIGIKTENKLQDLDAVASYALLLKGKFPDSDENSLVMKGQY